MTNPEALTAIVLVAGVGSRLRPLTDSLPKCLAPVGSSTILGHTLEGLHRAGVGRVLLVTGYREAQVREACAGFGDWVRFAHSARYAETQNVVSLAVGLEALEPGAPFAKLDGDLLLAPSTVARLLREPGEGLVAVERNERLGEEEMKVRLDEQGRIASFGKGLEPATAAGESIGFELFRGDLAAAYGEAIVSAARAGRTQLYYEDVYNDLVGQRPLWPAYVSSEEWIEVDDAEDLRRAAERFERWSAQEARDR